MFGIRRRKTHGQLVKAELGESFGHFTRAATHAASGIGETVGPRIRSARTLIGPAATRVRGTATTGWQSTVIAVAPLAAAAVGGARQVDPVPRKARSRKMTKMRMGRKQSLMARRKWSILTGLLAAGAIAGTVGAMAARRRSQPDWDSYDPDRVLESVRSDAEAIVNSSAETGRRDAPKGAPVADKARVAGPDHAKAATTGKANITEKVTDRPTVAVTESAKQITDSAKQAATKGTGKPDGVLGANPPTPSRNSRN